MKFFASFISLSLVSVLVALVAAAPVILPIGGHPKALNSGHTVEARAPKPDPYYIPANQMFPSKPKGSTVGRRALNRAEFDTRALKPEEIQQLFTFDGLKTLLGLRDVQDGKRDVDVRAVKPEEIQQLFTFDGLKALLGFRDVHDEKRALTSAELQNLFTLDTLKQILGLREEMERRGLSGGDVADLNKIFSLDGLKHLLGF